MAVGCFSFYRQSAERLICWDINGAVCGGWGPGLCVFMFICFCDQQMSVWCVCRGRTHGKHSDMWKRLSHRCSLRCTCTSAKRGLPQPPLSHHPCWDHPTRIALLLFWEQTSKAHEVPEVEFCCIHAFVSQSWVPARWENPLTLEWSKHSTTLSLSQLTTRIHFARTKYLEYFSNNGGWSTIFS